MIVGRRSPIATTRENLRVSRSELTAVLVRLAALLKAELPAGEALAIGAGSGGRIGAIFARAASATAQGHPLSSALLRAGCRLSAAESALVVAGERSAGLARAVGLLAARLEQSTRERRQLAQVLAYPAIVLITTLAVMTALAVFVMPAFVAMYAAYGVEPPASTRLAMIVGHALLRHGLHAGAAAATCASILVLARARVARLAWALDRVILALPLVGRLVRITERARIWATMALLVAAGLEVDRALALATPCATNLVVRRQCERIARLLRSGVSLSTAVARSGLDSSSRDCGLLRVAEASGDYATCMQRLSGIAAAERMALLERVAYLAEPLTVTVVALVVGATVVAVYQPVLGSAALLSASLP